MACLRDAQLTVQMLLNQNDYPKALECIETAQDVLNNELRGVTCFRLNVLEVTVYLCVHFKFPFIT